MLRRRALLSTLSIVEDVLTFPLYLTIPTEYRYCNEIGNYCYYREPDKVSISLYNYLLPILLDGNRLSESIYINNLPVNKRYTSLAPSINGGYDIEIYHDFGNSYGASLVYLTSSGLLYTTQM